MCQFLEDLYPLAFLIVIESTNQMVLGVITGLKLNVRSASRHTLNRGPDLISSYL